MYYYLRDRYHNYQTWYKNNKSNFLLCRKNIFTLRKLWATCPLSESNNLKENIHSNRRELSLVQFSSVQSVVFDSGTPWTAACQASITDSEFIQAHVYWVCDAIQPSHSLSSPSPPAFNLFQHQGLFKWVSFSHQVAKVLEFQHQSFQWIFRTDFL